MHTIAFHGKLHITVELKISAGVEMDLVDVDIACIAIMPATMNLISVS